ncbi:MAG: DNA topoisomerase-3 [Gammaproteobacteria bacterium]|jgi:DNA topoisomerase-3
MGSARGTLDSTYLDTHNRCHDQRFSLRVVQPLKVVLAEKPSVARELAQHLGARHKRDGWFEGGGFQVTWAFGHLAGLKSPDEYDPALKRWTLETLPFIPERFELRLRGDKSARQQFATIKRLFRAADSLVCATDAGREGELIFRYIASLAGCDSKPAERLWLSSMTPHAIRDAFEKLRPVGDYDNLYAAARCRSQADWIVGLNATRNFTVRYGASGVLWSVGRVQTPVLAMIVDRDDEIRHFEVQDYWDLSTRYRDVKFSFTGDGTRERHGFVTADDARALLAQVTGVPLEIEQVCAKTETGLPPRLFDLTTLQRDMNQRYRMSAQATLDVAQDLYEKKLITYPRTDSRHLQSTMHTGVRTILESLSTHRAREIGLLELHNLPKSRRVFDDNKVTDHHAIVPTGQLPSTLTRDHQRVYDAIVTRLIAAFYPSLVKAVTTVYARSAGVPFRAKGTRVVEPGWTSLYPHKKSSKGSDNSGEQVLPAFERSESGPHEPRIEHKQTKPVRAFSESSLLGAMETAGRLVDDEELREALKAKGLGTPATRAAIIETLLARGYVERQKNTLKATDLGRYLVSIIVDDQLKSPEMTGEWESKLKRIEAGRQDADEFMREIADYIRNLVATSLGRLRSDVLGQCPHCGAAVIEGKRAFGCSQWRAGCSFVLPREYRGVTVDPTMARELLQRHIVLRAAQIDGAARVLRMTANGVIDDIGAPRRERQPYDARKRGSPGAPRRARTANVQTPLSPSSAKPAQGKPSAGKPSTVRQPVGSALAGSEVCSCPRCGRPVVESQKGYGCSGWREGCRVTVWKQIAGKKITRSMAAKVLTNGRTQVLKGFVSKAGKSFDARLVWQHDEVGFEFSNAGL